MQKQIFLYKRSIKLTKKTQQILADQGFIPIAVDDLRDAKVVNTFPDVDNTWLLSNMMDLIMNGNETDFRKQIRTDLGTKLLQEIRERYTPKSEGENG